MTSPTPRQRKSHSDTREYWRRGQQILEEIKSQPKKSITAWRRAHWQDENRNIVNKMVHLAKTIDAAELEELLAVGPQGKAESEDGRPLVWEHFVVLMAVKDRAKRLEMAKLASRENLSPNELRERFLPRREGEKRGRKPLKPTTPKAVLQKLRDFLGGELERLNQITDSKTKSKFKKVQELLERLQKEVETATKPKR